MPVSQGLYYTIKKSEKQNVPIVLIHGAGGSHLYWPPEIRRLPNHTVYALDLPGHGKSSGHGEQSLEDYTRMLINWLDSIQLHRVILVGHSMGGAIAMLMALRHPLRVKALVLLATSIRLQVNPQLLNNMENPVTFEHALDQIVTWSFSSEAPTKLVELARERFHEARPGVLKGDFLACNRFDIIDSVESIKQPTLVICGTADKMTPLRNSQLIATKIPAADLVIIPDAGHMVMLEKPQEVSHLIIEFLKTQ